jgi:GNAT superfamily N-acetyltransferase
MKDTIIRKGLKEDLPAVLELIKELSVFEKAPNEVTNTLAAMEEEFTAPNPVFRLLVADRNKVVVGMAIYFIKYSTWKGRGVFLDDFVVQSNYRGRGIGKSLFDRFLDEAKQLNAKQIHWQVLDWNKKAINFYKKYDASMDSGWIDCKLFENQQIQE